MTRLALSGKWETTVSLPSSRAFLCAAGNLKVPRSRACVRTFLGSASVCERSLNVPTEIWREVVARRTRYAEVRSKLAAGEVREINDLITLNLDIRQVAQDVIEHCEGPDLLRAFWKAIEGVTVLDPSCGSGAFLFAALNILEPLYETCLDRMEAFVAGRRS